MRGRVRILGAAVLLVLAGCTVSVGDDGVTIGVLDIVRQPEDARAAVGATASFSVAVLAVGVIRYQWRRDGADLAGATQSTYTTPPVTAADDGARFAVRVCNEAACTLSAEARLTVLPR